MIEQGEIGNGANGKAIVGHEEDGDWDVHGNGDVFGMSDADL